ESVTCTLKLNVPVVPVGVPVIIPPLKLRVSGNELPAPKAQVSPPAPPFAASCRLYGTPRDAGVIAPVVATLGGVATVTVAPTKFECPVSEAMIVTGPEGGAAGAL